MGSPTTIGGMHWKDLGFIATHWVWILLAVIALTFIETLWKSQRQLKLFTAFWRWMLVALVFCIILVASRPLRDLESLHFENKALPAATGSQPGTDAIRANVDELKWLLTILAGFAVITAIAQAAAAWFSALTYDKQATAKLEEIDKVLEGFKARYPVFHEVEEKRNEAHDTLSATLRRVFAVEDPNASATEAISWMEDFYHELDIEKRQLLLSVESFASIDLHPPRKGGEVQNLTLFAVFYHAKFRYEKKMKAAALFTDLERAEGYLLLALRKSPSDFTLHNELGNIYLTMWESVGKLSAEYPNYLDKARDEFLKSRDLQRAQQRAYYNLAYIESAWEKKYDAARDWLEKALTYTTWQRVTTPDTMTAYVHYNLACNLARILVRDHTGASSIDMTKAEPVLSALKKASEIGRIRAEYVQIDYTSRTKGDIYGLCEKADEAVRNELNRLKEALIAEKTKKPQQGFAETLAEAFDMVWNSAKESFRNKPS